MVTSPLSPSPTCDTEERDSSQPLLTGLKRLKLSKPPQNWSVNLKVPDWMLMRNSPYLRQMSKLCLMSFITRTWIPAPLCRGASSFAKQSLLFYSTFSPPVPTLAPYLGLLLCCQNGVLHIGSGVTHAVADVLHVKACREDISALVFVPELLMTKMPVVARTTFGLCHINHEQDQ